MDETDKEFMEFIEKLRKTETGNVVHTIPEVFGIQYKEVYITKWLAYLLRQKYFSWKILNALIGSDIVKENDIKNVYTEFVFKNGRRIDILIETQQRWIGIENKIWSGEQKNQTSDYKESMKELSSDEECIGIYLHPEQNKSESNYFKNITYTELYDELSKIDYSDESTGSFEKMMFEQFMLYIKECLYMKKGEFPEISENAILYAQFINKISEISDEYKSTYSKIIDWLKYKFENNEGSKYEILESAEGYMQLAPKGCKDKWKEIGFHFEILWSRDFMINGIVKIEAHQEKTKGDNISQVFNILKITDVEYRGHNKPVDTGKSVSCNFATKDNAEDSFMKILSELERLRAKHEEWETIT